MEVIQNRLINRFGKFTYILNENRLTEIWKAIDGRQKTEYDLDRIKYYSDFRRAGESAWKSISFYGLMLGIVASTVSRLLIDSPKIRLIVLLIAILFSLVTFSLSLIKKQYYDFYDSDRKFVYSIMNSKDDQITSLIKLLIDGKEIM